MNYGVAQYRYEESRCSFPLETKLRVILFTGADDRRNAAVRGRDDCESEQEECRAPYE